MKQSFSLIMLLALVASCQAPAPTSISREEAVARRQAPGTQKPAAPSVPPETRRVFDPAKPAVRIELTGKVSLISDKGLGVLGDDGAGVISNNSGNIVSSNGGSLVSKNKYGLLAGPAASPLLLADAVIEVLDAEGRLLTDGEGRPITATTDQSGGYRLQATLPAEHLVLRVRLFPNEAHGGELLAMLPGGQAEPRALDIDTASSFGASYVLDRYVRGQQAVFDRLPRAEADALQAEMREAIGMASEAAPSYRREDMVRRTEALRRTHPELDTRLERIEAMLLAGQKDLGDGLTGVEIALAGPTALALDAQGHLYVAEGTAGRIRKLAPDGTVSTFAGPGVSKMADGSQATFSGITAIRLAPDGSMYVAEAFTDRVQRIAPDGVVHPVAGNGVRGRGATGGPAAETSLILPGDLALGPDGTLYLGELPDTGEPTLDALTGRILLVDAQGRLQEAPCPEPRWQGAEFSGLASTADGTLYAFDGRNGQIARKRADAAWEFLLAGRARGAYNRLLPTRDGALYFTESSANRVSRLLPDGTVEPVAGTGSADFSGDGGPATAAALNKPAGMVEGPDGTLYLADAGNNMVRAIAPDGTIRTVAGTHGLTQQGDALAIAINQPAALAIDAQGRVVFAEIASDTIKRLENGRLTVIAGTGKGSGGDGGPATSAQFDWITGLAYGGDTLYVTDSRNRRLRAIGPDGTIETVAGGGPFGWNAQAEQPALPAPMRNPIGLAVGPNGAPYWADMKSHVVLTLNPAGKMAVVAGALDGTQGDTGDGGPAVGAKLNMPFALGFDAQGALYVADAGNCRIRKIAPDGTISTAAGQPTAATIAALRAGAASGDGGPAAAALLVAPAAICFDDEGAMYVAEAGAYGLVTVGQLPAALVPDSPARIRKIAPDGTISTVAGPGSDLLADPAGETTLRLPVGMAFDAEGRLVIADGGTNQVIMLPKGAL